MWKIYQVVTIAMNCIKYSIPVHNNHVCVEVMQREIESRDILGYYDLYEGS